MRGRELILTTGVVFSLSLVVSAGGIIEWNSEKTSGIWSDGANWIGNVAPTAEDAAKFTVGAEGEIVVSVEEVSVAGGNDRFVVFLSESNYASVDVFEILFASDLTFIYHKVVI